MTWFWLAAGLVLLVIGGDLLVRGAVALAQRMGVSPLVIGLTLVGFGTSAPELVTSIEAALIGSPGIAVGNVVGSNIANILLILGLGAIILPVAAARSTVMRDGTAMLAASVALVAIVQFGEVTRLTGFALFAGLVAYTAYTWMSERRRYERMRTPALDQATMPAAPRPLGALLMAAGGLGITLYGATLLVDSAIRLAADFGVSETLIGLTVVAIGTSLPELVTTVVAALRRHSDVALGNILGSNIYNIFGILGVTAIVKPIAVPPEIAYLDIWVMFASALLLVVFAHTGARVNRTEGGLLLGLYALYIGWLGAAA